MRAVWKRRPDCWVVNVLLTISRCGTYLELYDSYLGYTYLCYSEHPEYYENQ